MPTIIRGKNITEYVAGVDGCRAGWVAVCLNLNNGALRAHLALSFLDLLDTLRDTRAIMVDMPIGLAASGKRACEIEARCRLSPLRHSSVFSAPRRPMLDFDNYASANAWGKQQALNETGKETGGGLSKQAWMITPKIREVDSAISAKDQARIGEAHPELAFWRLNGEAPCRHSKHTGEGRSERQRLLMKAGLKPDPLFKSLKEKAGSGVKLDDVYDACALSLSARAQLDATAIRLGDGARDCRGLRMEIWG